MNLEAVANRELHFARRASRSGDLTEGGSRNVERRQAEAVVVESIEGFPTDLKRLAL